MLFTWTPYTTLASGIERTTRVKLQLRFYIFYEVVQNVLSGLITYCAVFWQISLSVCLTKIMRLTYVNVTSKVNRAFLRHSVAVVLVEAVVVLCYRSLRL